MELKSFIISVIFLAFMGFDSHGQTETPGHLTRSLDEVSRVNVDISTNSAHYKPFFGEGDQNSEILNGIKRYGHLSIMPNGESEMVNYGREELIYFVLEGTGTLHYGNKDVPVSKEDFFYIPIKKDHGFSNPREDTLELMVMGFKVPESVEVEPTPELPIASAEKVPKQILSEGHGPTSSYQLLMGTKESERDRLASAFQMVSLYTIEFEPGGTNKVHNHPNHEEIYFMLEGNGFMAAGETVQGDTLFQVAGKGDGFYFAAGALVGFYSDTKKGEKHARILAVRSKDPEADQ